MIALNRRRYMGGGKKENPYAEYLTQYLTFEMLEAGTISISIPKIKDRSLGYSVNNGEWVVTTWSQTSSSPDIVTTPQLSSGDVVRWKSSSPYEYFSGSYYSQASFSTTGSCNIYGNALSLIYGDNFVGKDSADTSAQIFRNTFAGTKCISAEFLIFPIDHAYQYYYIDLFASCTTLVKGPAFLSSTMDNNCFYTAFNGCTSLASLTILADTVNTSQNNWARNVPSGGVLTKKTGTTWNLLPTGWTINYISI